ncbi:MAG TPA: transcription antitermination factor NusB [Chloroflexota bacterium]|nr:transcription antitermination factor NusB [Chloroflexota bacterium]
MKPRRRAARGLAFETLFELESRPARSVDEAIRDRTVADEGVSEERFGQDSMSYARGLIDGTLQFRDEIDRQIAAKAPAFPIEQMPVTDRVALELALYELLYAHDAPVSVIINEAVELAKRYGGSSSGRFVNGVLGTIAEELAG